MKESFISFFQDYGVAIQTVTSITLLIVTAIYVVATFKMIHATQKTFLRPTKMEHEEGQLKITIKNYGPGTAINIKTFIECKEFNKNFQVNSDLVDYVFEVFKERYIITNTESFEAEPNQNIEFLITRELKTINKVIVYWESISGEKTIVKFFVSMSSVGNIRIVKYKRIKIKSVRNIILNPIQFLTKRMIDGSMVPTYADYIKAEKKKKEKENRKWLL